MALYVNGIDESNVEGDVTPYQRIRCYSRKNKIFIN